MGSSNPTILGDEMMLSGAMLVWFVLTGASLVLLLVDLLTNSPVSWVQKLGIHGSV